MISVLIHILEGIFVVGLAGSLLVLVLTAVDDFHNLFGRDGREH